MVVTRSYHATKGAANSAAARWKRKGFKVFVEFPQINLGKNKKFRVVTEGRASTKQKGHIWDITKTQRRQKRFSSR